jgi:hypothetical protein
MPMSMASLVTSQCKSITCDFVTSSGSAFSAIDKGFANRIRQDIRRLGLGPSDMYYTVSYFGETNRDPVLCWKEDYPSILEVFEVTDQGVLAITPQRIKSQSLVGESIVAGLFQAASDVPDFRLMGSVNAVHAGDDRYSLSKMNGYQLSEWLRDNYSEYKDTPILNVEDLPQSLKDFDEDPVKFEPTMHQLCILGGHIVGSKNRDLGIGIFDPTLLPITEKDYTFNNEQVIKTGMIFQNWGQE